MPKRPVIKAGLSDGEWTIVFKSVRASDINALPGFWDAFEALEKQVFDATHPSEKTKEDKDD